MSVLTDVVVITGDGEAGAVAFVNGAMAAHHAAPGYYELRRIGSKEDHGGGKVASTEVWGGCYNFLPHEEFLDALKAAPWLAPWAVVVYVDFEMADGVEVWTPRDGYLRKPGPAGSPQ